MGILGTAVGEWSPGIGDPSPVGWITVAAYAAAAVLVWRARRVAIRAQRAGQRGAATLFWGVLLVGTLALGVNKQLDVQSGLAEWGRDVVRAIGWFEHRQAVQIALVAVVALSGGALCAWLAHVARGERSRVLLPLSGWVLLCLFVSIRAISFHHVDRFLGVRVGGARLGAFLELSGIAVLAAGAFLFARRL